VYAKAQGEAMAINLQLNAQSVRIDNLDPHTTLLNYLRQRGLTGSKEGCAEGECGACAVLLLRPDSEGSRLESVNSCLLPLASLEGHEVWTVEGLARHKALHKVQQAMLQGGSQCGYCTPGFIVSMAAEYYRKDRTGFDIEALSGNLCRCTGYRPIKDAATSLGKPANDDTFVQRLRKPVSVITSSSYTHHGQSFHRPATLAELLELLQKNPKAKLIAGGTDWVVEINHRFARSDIQIGIDQIPELKTLRYEKEFIELGAGLTLSELEHQLGNNIPLLQAWFPLFASKLIRNRATLGGNIATASPIGDSPPVLLALDARLILVSNNGEREVVLKDFFKGYRQTDLQTGEVIKAIRIPLPLAPQARFYKVAKRRMDDISTVAAGFALEHSDSVVKSIKIGLGGVAATPVRAYKTENYLMGKPWSIQTITQAKKIIHSEFKPIDDFRGSAAYRVAMLKNLLEKFFIDTGGAV
jgi:xanthine dehydrogenase small subunit